MNPWLKTRLIIWGDILLALLLLAGSVALVMATGAWAYSLTVVH